MPKCQTDYTNTVIYKICCNDTTITDIYIGHTTNFLQRRNRHKLCCCNENSNDYNRYVYKFIREHGGWDNWTMIQIEEITCNSKREAEACEHCWIEKLSATLNSNKPYAKCKEEPVLYKHCWYEEKKDYVLQKAKQHYQDNKSEIIEKVKQYAEQNKAKIAENKKVYREQHKELLAEQKKIYREAHKEEAAKAQKEWREANKEKLKEKKSQIIQCECGTQHTFANKHRHLQSKIHMEFINPLCKVIEPQLSEEEKAKLEEERKAKMKEQQKKYREEHTEQIKTSKQIHYEQNKANILEQQRKYKEEHKEELKEQNKKYMEDNKDKIQARQSKWYEDNKAAILQKQKEMTTCDCGAQIRKSGKAQHLRSKKHNDYLATVSQHV
jgi:hypothetical protein